MKKVSLFVVTTLLTITIGAEANDTNGENLISTSSQQVFGQTDGKSGNGAFSCSPHPDCGNDTSSTWLDLLIQQFTAQSQDENKKTQNN